MSQKRSSPSLSRCDSDPLHRRPSTQKKGIQTSSANQKKLVGRITNLESQLGEAQEELKIMKFQLNSSDTVKRVKSKKSLSNPSKGGLRESRKRDEMVLSEISNETDVFEVPIENKHERIEEEINVIKVMLEKKEKELEISLEENERLKIEVEEMKSGVAAAEAKEEEMHSMLSQLEESKEKRKELILKVEGMEAAKEEMESEMKKLRIQTEQWRKAADAAALVLSEEGKRRMSMGKQYGNIFENPVGVGGYNANEFEDVLVGHGKRRGSGIGMLGLGELWKKKGQK